MATKFCLLKSLRSECPERIRGRPSHRHMSRAQRMRRKFFGSVLNYERLRRTSNFQFRRTTIQLQQSRAKIYCFAARIREIVTDKTASRRSCVLEWEAQVDPSALASLNGDCITSYQDPGCHLATKFSPSFGVLVSVGTQSCE
jgi:hypothetical protein